MTDKAEAKLTKEETRLLKDSIEKVTDEYRVPKEEHEVIKNLKQTFKKLKIENNRENKEETVHYGDRMSRRDDWNKFQRSPRFKDFRRSDSIGKPGFFRSKSGNNYLREPTRDRRNFSRTSSNGARSTSRNSGYNSSSSRNSGYNPRRNNSQDPKIKERLLLKEMLEGMDKEILGLKKTIANNHEEMKEMFKNVKNVGFIEEEDDIEDIAMDVDNVRF